MSFQIVKRLELLVPNLVKVVATTGYLVVHETLGRVVYADQVVEGREQPPLNQAVCLLTLGDDHYICPSEALRWCVEGGNPPGEDLLAGAAAFAKVVEKWGIIRVVHAPQFSKETEGLGPTELGFKVIKFGERQKYLINKFEFKTFFQKLKGTNHA
ncbi:MAG: hypothetical protein ACRCTP_03905 [Aeromonas popoffii]|uniref:hypothetical protein n=1 Tax=Aeromonas popoffii TaxID=70856 RepID=UPI003F400FED